MDSRRQLKLVIYTLKEVPFDDLEISSRFQIREVCGSNSRCLLLFLLNMVKETHLRIDPENIWLHSYKEIVFFQLFRMKKQTFYNLLEEMIKNDEFHILRRRYCGGNVPVDPEKCLLVFLWYISHQDTLHSIADRFDLVPSTVMKIVNACLYIIIFKLRSKYIVWPKSKEEFEAIIEKFQNYPRTIRAIDGTKITIKVLNKQHDSYMDRYHNHSITVMAICTHNKIFTYVFIGFPGSSHDSRVFSLSVMARSIKDHGPERYFPNREWHLIGDSAFLLNQWLMTPYRLVPGITRAQKHHNYKLSADRVVIEHSFGLVEGRWRCLTFINVYAVAKAMKLPIRHLGFIIFAMCREMSGMNL